MSRIFFSLSLARLAMGFLKLSLALHGVLVALTARSTDALARGTLCKTPFAFVGKYASAQAVPRAAAAVGCRHLTSDFSAAATAAGGGDERGHQTGTPSERQHQHLSQQEARGTSGDRSVTEASEEEIGGQQAPRQCLLDSHARNPTLTATEEELSAEAEDVSSGGDRVPLTAEAVEEVLREIQPMLRSHGGAVRLVQADIEKRQVYLELLGACVGCPSSSVTLRNGIEATLREVWPGVEVLEASPSFERNADVAEAVVNAETVGDALSAILPAIEQMGGSLSIADTGKPSKHAWLDGGRGGENGGVSLLYEGPNAITVKYGLEMELRDKLPGGLDTVTVEARESDA
ncbi:hypothetical protein cyc_07224 [Cyclospora cayetanensis]|uniref:NIF system FeS cluster assembly NifU C-terminal domain-containing protein n=1 Tax=Cyclospora cayetanensis TaxID=88456 RepID=A0A1D3D0B7_9EIME|nr:hypothetical protein cyc_07224 [Cyclospora cayetanensis]